MDKETLKKSLCSCSVCSSGSYLLEEKGDDATLRAVTMCDIPQNALVIKMDKVRFSNFLIDRKEIGFNKHSDYIIVTDDKIVFIEMQSKTEVNQELIDECRIKFISDGCSLDYSDSVFKKILHKKPFFEKKEYHYVLLFQALPIAKTPTHFDKLAPNLHLISLDKYQWLMKVLLVTIELYNKTKCYFLLSTRYLISSEFYL